MKRFTSFAIAIAFSVSTPAFAQQQVTVDTARTNTVVEQVMQTYRQGLNEIRDSVIVPATQPGTTRARYASCSSKTP